MNSRIKLLPDSVANQIAAGEVVNRPASVVKELVENAVDAGAKSVTVNFRDGGRELIQIKDDGVGMTPQDARLAFERHATSKISSVDDIYSLVTFGFRGEALASIAAVAEVEMQTRTEEQEVGSQLFIDGGAFRDQRPVASATGTQIFVRNLFYNVPARKKFLDKASNESAHVLTEFQRAALAHPEVAFRLFRDDAMIYDLPAGSLRDRIVGVAGKMIGGRLLEVEVKTSIAKVRGFVGAPDSARKRMKEQLLFVNGRFFKNLFFHRAVVRAYEKLIPFSVQPPYFIYLEVDPEQIDVNVHPQKTEVKFADSAAVWQIINAAVRETLAKSGAVPMMDFDDGDRVDIPVLGAPFGGVDRELREPAVVRSGSGYNPFVQYERPQSIDEFDGGFDVDEPVRDIFSELEQEEVFTNVTLLGEGYAAAKFGTRFVAIDLRRAREAVLYDRLESMVATGRSVTQQLLFPERMVFSVDDFQLLRDNVGEFVIFGFDLRLGDEFAVEIMGLPSDVAVDGVDEMIYEMLDSLRDGIFDGDNGRRQKLAAVVARSASSAANVSRLSVAEVETLLGVLRGVRNHNFTPGGKAVMVEITVNEIRNKLK